MPAGDRFSTNKWVKLVKWEYTLCFPGYATLDKTVIVLRNYAKMV